MNTNRLRNFVEIVKAGSVTEAARILRIAQPALSQQMLQLEEEVGVPLLVRTPRGVFPTAAGSRLIEHAISILRQMDDAIADVRGYASRAMGRVVIGLPSSASSALAIPLVNKIRASFPDIDLKVVECPAAYVRTWILEGRLDMGIVYDLSEVPDLDLELLLYEDLCLFGAIDKPRPPADEINFDDLAPYPMIMPGFPDSVLNAILSLAARRAHSFNVILEIDAPAQLHRMVADGVGYSTISRAAIDPDIRAGTFFACKIVNPTVTRPVVVATASRKASFRPCIEVRQALAEIVRIQIEHGVWQVSDSRSPEVAVARVASRS